MFDKRHVTALLAAGTLVLAASAQQPGMQQAQQDLQQRFESSGLKVGAQFPAIDVYDSKGAEFNTRSLKGKYTVIVNGCLT